MKEETMRSSFPILGIALATLLAFGAGCAEEDGLFGVGGTGGKKTNASASPSNGTPTPTPSGSGFSGGIK
jgi:hypothetical protein